MSASDLTTFGGGGTLSVAEPFPDTTASGCSPIARVVIDGVEVPWVAGVDGGGGLETQMRKTGVADITRTSTVHIPYEWQGRDIISTLGGFDNITARTVRIDVRDEVTDTYGTVHHGPLVAVGPSGSIDGAFQIRVDDWANVLDAVHADESFVDRFTAGDVIRYVTQQATAHELIESLDVAVQQFDRGVTFGTDEDITGEAKTLTDALVEQFSVDDTADLADIALRGPFGEYLFGDVETNKSFTPNRHTLVDVLDWITTLTESYWWMSYDGSTDTPLLVISRAPTQQRITAQSLSEDASAGDVRLLSNNALFQISPQHTLRVNGKTTLSQTDATEIDTGVNLLGLDEVTLVENSEVYPTATVQHTALASRAGTNDAPPELEAETTTIADTVSFAKRHLKKRIDSAAGGQMTILPAPFVQPYTRIEAVPACDGRVEDLTPITYEIEEVIHDLSPPTTRTDAGHTTICRCGTTATRDDIEVVESKMVTL